MCWWLHQITERHVFKVSDNRTHDPLTIALTNHLNCPMQYCNIHKVAYTPKKMKVLIYPCFRILKV